MNMPTSTRGLTAELIESVRTLRYEDLSADALEFARHCILDFLACSLAGTREPLVEILMETVARPERSSETFLIGRPERVSRLTAALVNGVAGHAFDFDDTHLSMVGHPTVPLLPALFAVADTEPGDGRRFLTAFVAGFELECRLGKVLGPKHYELGFHTTGTVGTFGAAAAVAHYLGFDADGWMRALGLAGTEAAGLKSGFGTMAKPLHAGRAAQAGLLAALLARGGFSAAENILETKLGFFATHAGIEPDVARLRSFAGDFMICETLFKFHAACYLTHAPIEAARRLRLDHHLEPERIESVTVAVNPLLLTTCNVHEPKTGLEGKFSLRATTALSLLGADTGSLATFEDARMTEARLEKLRDRIAIATDAALSVTQSRVAVVSGGRRVESDADSGVPATDLAEQGRRLRDKFITLAAPEIGGERAADLADRVLTFDASSDPKELFARVRG